MKFTQHCRRPRATVKPGTTCSQTQGETKGHGDSRFIYLLRHGVRHIDPPSLLPSKRSFRNKICIGYVAYVCITVSRSQCYKSLQGNSAISGFHLFPSSPPVAPFVLSLSSPLYFRPRPRAAPSNVAITSCFLETRPSLQRNPSSASRPF